MSGSTLSERALRQAWRQADLKVARSLAALCYRDVVAGSRDAERLSRSVLDAARQRQGLADRLHQGSPVDVVRAAADAGSSFRPVEQIVQATGQTRALRPSPVASSLSLLRQRLSVD